ncbi:MAG: precorrin-3B synthase [Albidovulum sp.]
MTAPLIKGWCPGALRPMMSGDGLVVRIRPHAGRLSPDQARGIADLADLHGNGLIDLSARANLQIRGVRDASYPALIEGLKALGLIDPNPEAEARRNIAVSPFWQEGDGTLALADALAAALGHRDAPELPGKFGFAIDCGPMPLLGSTSADIRLERAAQGALILRADGAKNGVLVGEETAVPLAMDLARWFLDAGGAPEGRGRMAALLARGAELPQKFSDADVITQKPALPPQPGPCAGGFLTGFEFGQITAETVSVLAKTGAFRLTPWRMLLIEGASDLPQIEGLITAPDDVRLRVTACTGAPGCPQGLLATRPLARALCSSLPEGAYLHVSGCAKGCAHPGPAPLVLTACADGTFNLIRAGRAFDQPHRIGLSPESLTRNPKSLIE